MIKNLFIIVALMITLVANSQARLLNSAQDIFDEFKDDNIVYGYDSNNQLYLLFYPDPNVSVRYFFDTDSVCTSTLICTQTQEMTDFIIGNYIRKGYLKVDDGWLMRDNDVIFQIDHFVNKLGYNMFYWH